MSRTKKRFITVGGRGQPVVPAPVLGVSLAQLVNDATACAAMEHLAKAADDERFQQNARARRDAHNLTILQARPGVKLVITVGKLRDKTVRLVEPYWHGRGQHRQLAVRVRVGRKPLSIWASEVRPVSDAVAERLEGKWS